jgi:hypothetical protein
MMEDENETDESATAQAVACLNEVSRRLKELSEEAAELCRTPLDETPRAH